MFGLKIPTTEVDLRFIRKNYLKKKYWSKTWTIFQYNDEKIVLYISYIDTENKKVALNVVHRNSLQNVMIHLDRPDITQKMFKKQLYTAMMRAVESSALIRSHSSETYERMRNEYNEKEESLYSVYLEDEAYIKFCEDTNTNLADFCRERANYDLSDAWMKMHDARQELKYDYFKELMCVLAKKSGKSTAWEYEGDLSHIKIDEELAE